MGGGVVIPPERRNGQLVAAGILNVNQRQGAVFPAGTIAAAPRIGRIRGHRRRRASGLALTRPSTVLPEIPWEKKLAGVW
jgi:hypothetical protein